MITGAQGILLIKSSEGCSLTAYKNKGDVPTIGYGNTMINGTPVKMGDSISQQLCDLLLVQGLNAREQEMNKVITVELDQNKWDACMSFVWNEGFGNFESSTLLKKINANPNDPTIEQEFEKWVWANDGNGGKVKLAGLITRRHREWVLYNTPVNV